MMTMFPPKQVEPADHARLWSQSTSASYSPLGSGSELASQDDQTCILEQVSQTRDGVKSKIPFKPKGKVSRKRRLNFGIEESKEGAPNRRRGVTKKFEGATTSRSSILPTRTPAVAQRVGPLKAELLKSPGGTDYIITPGKHRIEMNEFLAAFDSQVANGDCPRMRGMANYAEHIHQQWLEAEKKIPQDVFMLSFSKEAPVESFRQMAIQSVFNYAVENQLHENTIHLTVLNISRLIHARVTSADRKALTHEMFACTVLAALRAAIKGDEYYEKLDRIRLDPTHIWRASGFINFVGPDVNSKKLNTVESECLALLQDPANPPLAPEFLQRYLVVGGWYEHRIEYQELASFLLGMSLFANGDENPLRGIPCSKLAGAALVLAVKIINTDQTSEHKFEFWPERLVKYTGYTMEDLKPGIKGLAYLLRNKPTPSSVLERYYTKWGQYDWN